MLEVSGFDVWPDYLTCNGRLKKALLISKLKLEMKHDVTEYVHLLMNINVSVNPGGSFLLVAQHCWDAEELSGLFYSHKHLLRCREL